MQNPWAGLASFEDPEKAERKLKFCGRDDDSYDVAKLIIPFQLAYGLHGDDNRIPEYATLVYTIKVIENQ